MLPPPNWVWIVDIVCWPNIPQHRNTQHRSLKRNKTDFFVMMSIAKSITESITILFFHMLVEAIWISGMASGINFDESNEYDQYVHVILLFWRIKIHWTEKFCARSLRVRSILFSSAPKICQKGVLRGLLLVWLWRIFWKRGILHASIVDD